MRLNRITRTLLALGIAATTAAATFSVHAQQMSAPPTTGATGKSITIHQEVDFAQSPQHIYEALLEGKQSEGFSATPPIISRELGGASSLFGGHIVTRNLELIPNRRIVQAWRVVTWPAGLYSIAKFELEEQGAGTRLVFDHTAFPDDQRDHLAEGWEENYWTRLKKYFR